MGGINAARRSFHGDCPRAERFYFKAVMPKFVADLGKNRLLACGKLHNQRQQQALALHVPRLPLPQDALKEHALVRDVLVNDPQTAGVGGDDKRITNLAQGLEIPQSNGPFALVLRDFSLCDSNTATP